MEHLKDCVIGMKMPFVDVFDNWPELIGMLASRLAGGKAIAAKL